MPIPELLFLHAPDLSVSPVVLLVLFSLYLDFNHEKYYCTL